MKTDATQKPVRLRTATQRKWYNIWRHREFYMFILPAFVLMLLFQYYPMYGVTLAFKDLKMGQTLAEGKWVGLKHFKNLFATNQFGQIIWNTVSLNFMVLLMGIPVPLTLALVMHNSPSKRLKAWTQTTTYLPYMVSMVVVVSLLNTFFSNSYGLINVIRANNGLEPIKFFEETEWFMPMYLISAVWQSAGYSAIVYLASLASIDQPVIEAATIDGATKLQRMWHIDLKLILSTVITMFLLNIGKIMGLSIMEKVWMMQNPANLEVSETIATYVYKMGMENLQYGFSTAVNLFNTGCNLLILFISNTVTKKLTGQGLL